MDRCVCLLSMVFRLKTIDRRVYSFMVLWIHTTITIHRNHRQMCMGFVDWFSPENHRQACLWFYGFMDP